MSQHCRPLVMFGRLAILAAATSACVGEDARRTPAAAGRLTASTAQRASLRLLGEGRDTLSDSARISRVAVERDGDAVAFIFADAAHGVTSGVGISQRRANTAQLLWPDSVSAVWWAREHSVAFMTSSGVGARVVVDVHAEQISIMEQGGDSLPGPTADPAERGLARARAVAFIDSLRVQPTGRPQTSPLRYLVTRVLHSPADPSVAMFYVVASDSTGGARVNPAWYALDERSGMVLSVDEVVGLASEMQEGAGGWSSGGQFLYAKGTTLWEATVGMK